MEPLYQLRCKVEDMTLPHQEWVVSTTGTHLPVNTTVTPVTVWGSPEWFVVQFTSNSSGCRWRVLQWYDVKQWLWRDSIPGDAEILGTTSAQTDWISLDEIMTYVDIYGIDRKILDALIEEI